MSQVAPMISSDYVGISERLPPFGGPDQRSVVVLAQGQGKCS